MDLIGLRETVVPRALDEVVLSAGVRPLGGGTWLFSEDQPGLEQLVDLTALGWDSIERTPDGLVIGATCTIGTLRPTSRSNRRSATARVSTSAMSRATRRPSCTMRT